MLEFGNTPPKSLSEEQALTTEQTFQRGLHLQKNGQFADAKNDIGEVTTLSLRDKFKDSIAKCRAAVPLETTNACFDPKNEFNFFSNNSIFFPWVILFCLNAFETAKISSLEIL